MNDRIHPFEGIHNFRDYGNYAAAGGRLRPNTLFRSGQHGAATSSDLARISDFAIATVIDLRGDSERSAMPCVRAPDFAGAVLFAPGETAGQELAPHEEAGRGIRTADEALDAMTRLYAAMPFRPVLIAALRLYFEALAERDGASLLHCLAGKDRTGLAVALLHDLMGVHRDDVMADYLLTNVAGDQEARIAAAAPSIRERYGSAITDGAIRALMSVDEAWLARALRAIEEAHGSTATYAHAVLGVDEARRRRIAERLVV
jgi:protein-tyrosine phosphatase